MIRKDGERFKFHEVDDPFLNNFIGYKHPIKSMTFLKQNLLKMNILTKLLLFVFLFQIRSDYQQVYSFGKSPYSTYCFLTY